MADSESPNNSLQKMPPSLPPEKLPDESVSATRAEGMWMRIKSHLSFCKYALAEDYRHWRWHDKMSAAFKKTGKAFNIVVGSSVLTFALLLLYTNREFLLSHKRWVAIVVLTILTLLLTWLTVALRRFNERAIREHTREIETLSVTYNEERKNIIASFKELQEEKVRQGRPKLTGSFQDFKMNYWRKREARDRDRDESRGARMVMPMSHNPTGTLVVVQVRFVNDNPTPTTLHNFSLTIKIGDKPFTAIYPEELYEREGWMPPELEAEEKKNVYLVTYLDNPSEIAKQGRRIQGLITFYFDGFMWQEYKDQDWLFTLTITDAWGERHEINQWGEPPRKPQRNL
jgi:hypothetical protein